MFGDKGVSNKGDPSTAVAWLPLFSIAGQSNALGKSDSKDNTNVAGITAPYPNVLIRRQLSVASAPPFTWASFPAQPAAPRGVLVDPVYGTMGSELTFARTFDAGAGRHGIAQFAIGSSSLGQWLPDNGPILPGTSACVFLEQVQFIQDTERALHGYLAGEVWIQGEADALISGQAALYQTWLTRRYTELRRVWPNLPIVIVRLHNSNTGTYKATIRTAQAAFVAATSNTALVNVDDLALQGDLLHFTADAYATIGQRCAAAMLSLVRRSAPSSDPSVWTSDATSTKAKPNGYWEWRNMMLSAGVAPGPLGGPSYHQRYQDLLAVNGSIDGAPHDSIGGLYYTVAGTPALETAISGWASKGLALPGATDALTAAAGTMFDVSAQSVFRILRFSCTHPAAEKTLFYLSATAPLIAITMLSTGVLKCYSNSTTANSLVDHGTGDQILVGLRYNKTAGTLTLLSSLEKLVLSYAVGVDGQKGTGAAFGKGPIPSMILQDDIVFLGTDAEMSDAQVKALYQKMGETIAWS